MKTLLKFLPGILILLAVPVLAQAPVSPSLVCYSLAVPGCSSIDTAPQGAAKINLNETSDYTTLNYIYNLMTTGGIAAGTVPASGVIGGPLLITQGGTGVTTLSAGLVTAAGTTAFSTVAAPSSTVVGVSDTQTLTNKSISGSTNTLSNISTESLQNVLTPATAPPNIYPQSPQFCSNPWDEAHDVGACVNAAVLYASTTLLGATIQYPCGDFGVAVPIVFNSNYISAKGCGRGSVQDGKTLSAVLTSGQPNIAMPETLANGTQVICTASCSGTGFTLNTLYYVVGQVSGTSPTIQLSATLNGSPITPSANTTIPLQPVWANSAQGGTNFVWIGGASSGCTQATFATNCIIVYKVGTNGTIINSDQLGFSVSANSKPGSGTLQGADFAFVIAGLFGGSVDVAGADGTVAATYIYAAPAQTTHGNQRNRMKVGGSCSSATYYCIGVWNDSQGQGTGNTLNTSLSTWEIDCQFRLGPCVLWGDSDNNLITYLYRWHYGGFPGNDASAGAGVIVANDHYCAQNGWCVFRQGRLQWTLRNGGKGNTEVEGNQTGSSIVATSGNSGVAAPYSFNLTTNAVTLIAANKLNFASTTDSLSNVPTPVGAVLNCGATAPSPVTVTNYWTGLSYPMYYGGGIVGIAQNAGLTKVTTTGLFLEGPVATNVNPGVVCNVSWGVNDTVAQTVSSTNAGGGCAIAQGGPGCAAAQEPYWITWCSGAGTPAICGNVSLTTSGSTATGSVLPFANTTGVAIGQPVTGTNIAPGATVLSFTGTTVTLSTPILGTVGASTAIAFGLNAAVNGAGYYLTASPAQGGGTSQGPVQLTTYAGSCPAGDGNCYGVLQFTDMTILWKITATTTPTSGDSWNVNVSVAGKDVDFWGTDAGNHTALPSYEHGASGTYANLGELALVYPTTTPYPYAGGGDICGTATYGNFIICSTQGVAFGTAATANLAAMPAITMASGQAITPSNTGGVTGNLSGNGAYYGAVGEYWAVQCLLNNSSSGTVTFSNGSPTTVTWTGFPFRVRTPPGFSGTFYFTCPLNFTTSGTLPTGIVAGNTYWLYGASFNSTAGTFEMIDQSLESGTGVTQVQNAVSDALSASPAHFAVANTAGQSGTQTGNMGAPLTTGVLSVGVGYIIPAGDFDCSGVAYYAPQTTLTSSGYIQGINNTVALPGTGANSEGFTQARTPSGSYATQVNWQPAGPMDEDSNATEVVLLLTESIFTAGTVNAGGFERCRRAD